MDITTLKNEYQYLTNEIKNVREIIISKLTLKQFTQIMNKPFCFNTISNVTKNNKILELVKNSDELHEKINYIGSMIDNYNNGVDYSNVIQIDFKSNNKNTIVDTCEVIQVNFKTKTIENRTTVYNLKAS